MQIFVKTLRGNTITIDISSNKTILDLKQKIYDKECIPITLISLYCGTTILYDNHKTLYDYHISKETTIRMRLNHMISYNDNEEYLEHPLIIMNYNHYFNDYDLKNTNTKISNLLDNNWKFEKIYKYKLENGRVYRSIERHYNYIPSYQKIRVQISLANYIVMHKCTECQNK